MNSNIRFSGFYIMSIAHTQCNVRTCVFRSVGRSRHKLTDIKSFIFSAIYNFLTFCLISTDDNRINSIFHRITQQKAKLFLLSIQQCSNTFTICQHTNYDFSTRMTFYIIENHCRSIFSRTCNGSTGTYMTIYTCQFCRRIYFYICTHKLTGNFFQSIQSCS